MGLTVLFHVERRSRGPHHPPRRPPGISKDLQRNLTGFLTKIPWADALRSRTCSIEVRRSDCLVRAERQGPTERKTKRGIRPQQGTGLIAPRHGPACVAWLHSALSLPGVCDFMGIQNNFLFQENHPKISSARAYVDGKKAIQIEYVPRQFHLQTLIIYRLGFNKNNYAFTLISLVKIVLCSKFP